MLKIRGALAFTLVENLGLDCIKRMQPLCEIPHFCDMTHLKGPVGRLDFVFRHFRCRYVEI